MTVSFNADLNFFRIKECATFYSVFLLLNLSDGVQ